MESFTGESWIKLVEYDEETQVMNVTMNNKRYDFYNVPRSIYDNFESAESRGKYYDEYIKDKYSPT